MTVRTGPGVFKYSSDEERRAARRETWRLNARRQRQTYLHLLRTFGINGRGKHWASHLAEIRHLLNPVALENAHLLRDESCPYKRWWLERYSLDEIQSIARGL